MSLPDLTPPDGIEIVERRTSFQGYFRIDEYVMRQRRFDGGWSIPMKREVFERGHAAAFLPYDPERNLFVLCQQFRIGAPPRDRIRGTLNVSPASLNPEKLPGA